MLQANNEQQAETAAAREAVLPHIAGLNEEDEHGQEAAARAAEEPPPPGQEGGDSSTIQTMDALASAKPPRQLIDPLMSLFTKLVKHGQHVFVRNTAAQPCSCERFLPPTRQWNR